ncbi:MAG TPA: alcohol dehydrogenase catalytic domain-containing protein [Euzebyales bacterium]|nr:alcohol dehydrogenase catalytic domain-containing protein [Euzebyales bacterium]
MPGQLGYRVHEWGVDPIWEEMPRPEAGPGEVLVQVEACGVGLTVLNCINGDLGDDPTLLPRVPGHELVGRIVGRGAGVAAGLEGRRVVAYFYLACGSCRACWSGSQPLCQRLAGVVGVHRDGGYAPFVALPAANVVDVPRDLDAVAATVVPDAVATPVHVCATRARVVPGDRVVVIGAGGGVGAHMIQVAALHGAVVAGFDRGDRKLEAIAELGAQPVDATDITAVDGGALWPTGPPTVVIDLVGTADSLAWATASLAPGGRAVVLTTYPDRAGTLSPRELVFAESSVLGSRYASKGEVASAAELVMSGRIRPVIGTTVGPGDVMALHAALRGGELMGRGALTWK